MELQLVAGDTVEPWPVPAAPDAAGGFDARRIWTAFIDGPAGRALLAALRWVVVIALVFAGYFAAEAINAGVELVQKDQTPPGSHQILAASAARK
jgi:hypothetical protein